MIKIKKLLFNKRGSEVVETLMIFPIFFYMILVTFFKIMSFSSTEKAYAITQDYTRTVAISQSLEKSLNNLLKEAEKFPELVITEIKINKTSLYFSTEETNSFLSYKMSDGSFNYQKLYSTQDSFAAMEEQHINPSSIWKYGATISVTCFIDELHSKDILGLTYKDPITHETLELSLGFDSSSTVNVQSIIYYSKN